MTTAINTLSHKMQRAAAGTLIDMALGYAAKDRQKAYLQMVDWARQFWGDGLPEESYDKARAALSDPDNKWVRYIDRVLDETDPPCGPGDRPQPGVRSLSAGNQEHPQKPGTVPVQHSLADPVRPHVGLQYALRGLLGRHLRRTQQPFV